MGKSIYEEACERLQPELLKMKSNLSFEETSQLVAEARSLYSKEYTSGYELVSFLAFENQMKGEKNSKTFEEIVECLKDKMLDELKLEAAFHAIANIYGRTFEETRDLYAGEKYWMSIGHLYPKA